MPESGSQDDAGERRRHSGRAGIVGQAASALSSFLDYLDARIQLLSLEAREARGSIVRRVAAAAAGVFLLVTGYLLLLAGGTALAAELFDKSWAHVALATGGGHLVLGALLLLAARLRLRGSPFRDSRKELEKDRQWLNELRPPE